MDSRNIPRFDVKTTGAEVVKTFASAVDGKTFVITGGSVNSLAAETAICLASASPSAIVLLGRTESKVTPVLEKIRKLNPSISTFFVAIDLSLPSSIKNAVVHVLRETSRIDVLMNSAGIMALPEYSTATMSPGHPAEIQLATNHLGPFLFTSLLFPALQRAPSPRIVNLTSTAFETTPFSFSDYNFSGGRTYNRWGAYGQSKTANVLFTVGLSQKQKKVEAFVIHPGMVLQTGIGKAVDEDSWKEVWEATKKMNIAPPTAKNVQEGCATGLVAALDPSLHGKSGAYLIDCNVMPTAEHATNPELAEKLWELSEELLGEKFVTLNPSK